MSNAADEQQQQQQQPFIPPDGDPILSDGPGTFGPPCDEDVPPPSYRSVEEAAAAGADNWDCCDGLGLLPPLEPDDLARASRLGPDRLAPTFAGRPRRLAVCHSLGGRFDGLQLLEGGAGPPRPQQPPPPQPLSTPPTLARQDSAAPVVAASVLLVKFYDVHDRLGVFDGHEGTHLGDLRLRLEPGSQFCDLCVSNRYQTVYLADQANSRVYSLDLNGHLRATVAKRLAAPQALCFDDRLSLLFVCQRRKLRVFQQRQQQQLRYVRSLKSPEFRNLTSAASRDGRLWLADSQADRVFLYAVRDGQVEPLRSLQLQNPLCVCLDASGCGLVASGEPLHRVSVFGPEGAEVGCFGGWGGKSSRMKLPTGVYAYQLSHLVDKRMVAVCCFAEHCLRLHQMGSPDTSVI